MLGGADCMNCFTVMGWSLRTDVNRQSKSSHICSSAPSQPCCMSSVKIMHDFTVASDSRMKAYRVAFLECAEDASTVFKPYNWKEKEKQWKKHGELMKKLSFHDGTNSSTYRSSLFLSHHPLLALPISHC